MSSCSHCSQLVLPQSFSPFFPMLSKEKSPTKGHTTQQPKHFYFEFKWSAPWDPLMTTSKLFGVASDESEDGLSREHSLGRDDQRLFSDTVSLPSSNKGTATPETTAFGEDEKCEVVTCAQPNDGEHLGDHHPSATDRGGRERGGGYQKESLDNIWKGWGGLWLHEQCTTR